MQPKAKSCYLCRSAENLTRDHIPPKNLFPKPLPTNLITVPCCKTCNESFSKSDEHIRAFLAMQVNVSPVGKGIMREKVFRQFLQEVSGTQNTDGAGVLCWHDPNAERVSPVPYMTIDRATLDPIFIRLTKGLLATHYPDIDYFRLEFQVEQLPQFVATNPIFASMISHLKAREIGKGVFRYWHEVEQKGRINGRWLYQFYGLLSRICGVANHATEM